MRVMSRDGKVEKAGKVNVRSYDAFQNYLKNWGIHPLPKTRHGNSGIMPLTEEQKAEAAKRFEEAFERMQKKNPTVFC